MNSKEFKKWLGTLCITLAGLWYADRDGPQGVFLQPIASLLARKTTQRTARARATTDRRELCRGFLGQQGATFTTGKGSHVKVCLNGKQSVLPMHSTDLKKGTLEGIKKQLGLK